MPQVVVTASVLNLRAGAGTSHPILTRVLQGDVLDALQVAPDGRWRRVRAQLSDGTLEGWVSTKYLAPVDEVAPAKAPAWFELAKREIGVKEYPGAQHNPRIVQYAKTTMLAAAADEVAWCSSFVNWCLDQAGVRGTRSAAARSWLGWGVPLQKPRPGCITVFSRGADPQSGHVAFYVAPRGAFLEVLGGNQSNQVKVAAYRSDRKLGYRWPKGVPLTA